MTKIAKLLKIMNEIERLMRSLKEMIATMPDEERRKLAESMKDAKNG